jgi:hypothetical protein
MLDRVGSFEVYMVHLLYEDEIESNFDPAVVMEGSPANIRGTSQTGLRR